MEAANCAAIGITNQPQSMVVTENCPVTFSVSVTGSAPRVFQWFRNDQVITNATNASYTIPYAPLSYDSSRFRVTVTNNCSQLTSAIAVLHISLDVDSPYLLRARGDATLRQVIAVFASGCGGIDPDYAQEPSNYSISGGVIVSNAVLDAARTKVTLTTSAQMAGTIYTLQAFVADLGFPPNQAETTTEFQAWVPSANGQPPYVPPPLAIKYVSNKVEVAWPPGGILQKAEQVTGPWTEIPDANRPYSSALTNGSRFFRVWFDP
jgi:hypothetical protein